MYVSCTYVGFAKEYSPVTGNSARHTVVTTRTALTLHCQTLHFSCGDGFMDFIYRPKSKILKILQKLKSQRFESWLCFHPQVNGGGEEKNTYSAGPVRQN
jgi:hypothetical protein